MMRTALRNLKTSPSVAALLFVALARGMGHKARLVCKLPLSVFGTPAEARCTLVCGVLFLVANLMAQTLKNFQNSM